jgi:hypothetical protein
LSFFEPQELIAPCSREAADVVEQEAPVGVIMIIESAAIYASGSFGIITELYVVPEERSASVAKALIDAAAFGAGMLLEPCGGRCPASTHLGAQSKILPL